VKNMRYIDPMKETPIGKLLGEVRLLKAKVEGKDKNLADNYPPYDKVTRGDIIAAVKGKKGKVKSKPKKDEAGSYKSDRGEKIGKGSDDDKMGCKGGMCKDDDCATCMKKGENDCSKCGKYIHFQDEPHWSASECSDCWTPDKKVKKAVEKNPALMALGGMAATGAGEGFGQGMAAAIDRRLPGGKKDEQKKNEGGDLTKQDATTLFLIEKGYGDKEADVMNSSTRFMDISGGEPVHSVGGYQGNQSIPFTTDHTSVNAISETANIPSVAQTGYDTSSSSLHMHLNDGGSKIGPFSSVAKVEESLGAIKKNAKHGQMGIVDEIGDLLEKVYARL
jgi:hypothetical protein